MAVYVKSHRRGQSMVHAFVRRSRQKTKNKGSLEMRKAGLLARIDRMFRSNPGKFRSRQLYDRFRFVSQYQGD